MIYFIFPVFNEEKGVSALIGELRKKMATQPYKMIAVNDGSSDNSLQILKDLAADDLVVETSRINMNVGAVFSSGIHRVLPEARDEDFVIIMESDQTSDINFIQDMIFELKENKKDIIIASRYRKRGRYVNFPLKRRIFSYCANYLMRAYFPIRGARDYTIFFRGYRVSILKKAVDYFGMFGLIQSKGFVANAELLIKLSLLTDRIAEVPFVYNYGRKIGKSKINVVRTINEYFVLINYLKRIFEKFHRYEISRRVSEPVHP